MYHREGSSLFALSLAWMSVALLVLGVGCAPADADGSIQIVTNQATVEMCPPAPTQPGNGVLQNGLGFIDTNANFGYVFTPLVVNQASTQNGQFDSSQRRVQLAGANVTIEFQDPGAVPGGIVDSLDSSGLLAASRRFTGSIEPDDGVLSVAFELWSPELHATMLGQLGNARVDLLATVQLFGTMAGGDVRSQEFDYPITICDGCLVNNLGNCVDLAGMELGVGGGACQALQDGGPATCCTTGDGTLVCDGIAPML